MPVAPNQGILAHHNADGSIHTYVAKALPKALLTHDASDVGRRMVSQFDDWAPSLRALIAHRDTLPLVRPIYALPPALAWPRTPGVTLLGDAAHVMSPFAGQGANLAMLDGMELARALICHSRDREAGLAAYERDLFARSMPVAQLSAANLTRFFGPEAPMSVVALFADC